MVGFVSLSSVGSLARVIYLILVIPEYSKSSCIAHNECIGPQVHFL